MKKLLRDQRGQNTVEYLMMLAVIVGVVLVIGRMFKPQVGGVLNQVMDQIRGGVQQVGG